MASFPQGRTAYDHPNRLRELLARAQGLASEHQLSSVLVGLGGFEGDLLFPEVVNFVESELRVDDSVFRMTRERAVLLLTDVDAAQARGVVERLLDSFREHFPSVSPPTVSCGYFEVSGNVTGVTAKEVLPRLFATPPTAH